MMEQPDHLSGTGSGWQHLEQAVITPTFKANSRDYDDEEDNERKKESQRGYGSPDQQSSESDSEEEGLEAALLGQLQELHRQLNVVRMETKQSQPSGRRMYDMRQKLPKYREFSNPLRDDIGTVS